MAKRKQPDDELPRIDFNRGKRVKNVKDFGAVGNSAAPPPLSFDLQHDGAMRVFCAALTGILANPVMTDQRSSPQAAAEFGVSFANAAVVEVHKRLTAEKEKT